MATPKRDSFEKSLLLLKATENTLIPLEKQLRAMGWMVRSTSSLNEALGHLLKAKPTFVMVSLDHGQRGVRFLPQILVKNFPVATFLFSESGRAQAFAEYTNLELYPRLKLPLTARSVEHDLLFFMSEEADQLLMDPTGSTILRPGAHKDWSDPSVLQSAQTLVKALLPPSTKVRTDLAKMPAVIVVQEPSKGAAPSDVRKVLEPAMLREAVHMSVDPGESTDVQVLQKTEVANCLPLENGGAPGYFVIVRAQDKDLDEGLKAKIANFILGAQSKVVAGQDWQSVKLDAVNFQEWAKKDAQFVEKVVHEGEEIAFAFFPMAKALPEMQISTQPELARLALSELKDGTKADFEMSIYLPANQKFLFYIARGAEFGVEQRQRIERLGIDQVHVPVGQWPQVEAYLTQVGLNEKVQKFQNQSSPSSL